MGGLRMTIGGRELLFRFDVKAWEEVENTFGSLERMNKMLEADLKPMQVLRKLAAITATAGERHMQGKMEVEPVTPEWLTEHLSPMQIKAVNSLAEMAVNLGNSRKNADDEDNQHEVDEVLEEIQKKNQVSLPPEK